MEVLIECLFERLTNISRNLRLKDRLKANELKDWRHIVNTCFCFEGEPEIDGSGNGLVAKVGEMVTLNCSALGYPSPQFIWNPSGKEVHLCAPNRFSLNLIFTSEKTL